MKTFSLKKTVLFIIKSRHSIHRTTVLKNMKVLDVKIDNLSRIEILDRVKRFLDEPKFHQIATVNPEFLVEADRNPEFKKVLDGCDLCVADGFGLSLVAFFRREKLKCRFPGADLMEEILRLANEKNLSVYLAVRADGLSSYDEVKTAILRIYPGLRIDGLDIDSSPLFGNWKLEIGNSAIVLCNFGAPAQELFLANLRNTGVESRVSMGVGGAFDYLTGKQRRAPKWMRTMGLEWLWRFALQPSRIARIWNATAVFLWKVITKK